MKHTVKDIAKVFNKFNKEIFLKKYNVLLPVPRFRVSTSKSIIGQFSYNRVDFTGDTYCIAFSNVWSTTQKEFEDTIIHEMIHEYIQFANIKDSSSHGRRFVAIMNDINRTFNRNISIKYKNTLVANEDAPIYSNVAIFTMNGVRRIMKFTKTGTANVKKALERMSANNKIADIKFGISSHTEVCKMRKSVSKVWYYTFNNPKVIEDIERNLIISEPYYF